MASGPVEIMSPGSPRAGVVVIPEIFGVDDTIREFAARLQAEGYAVALPDLWWRQGTPDFAVPGSIPLAVEALVDSQALLDVRMALGALSAAIGSDVPLFVLGFCVGGLYARMAACTLPGLAGAVEFYGRVVYPGTSANKPVQPLDLAAGLGCPIQCHFGSADPVAPPQHVDLLEQRLSGRAHAAQIFRYPGCGHAFMNPRRLSPDAAVNDRHTAAARLAWSRTLRFLDEHT